MVESRYRGKLFSILGDSISTLEGYSDPPEAAFYQGMMRYYSGVYTPKESWWGQVIEALGGKVLVNNSFSGSTVVKRPEYQIPSYGCSDERTSALSKRGLCPEVILVFLGTNDWGYGVRIEKEQGQGDDPTVFSTAYGRMLDLLRTNYPQAEILCLTLPRALEEGLMREDPLKRRGRSLEDYCAAIKKQAAARGCGVVDLYDSCPSFERVDDFHPNATGMRSISRAVLGQLQGEDI